MRRSHLARLMAALSSLGLFAYPVQALPFHKTSNSFAAYLNSLDWNNGKDMHFFRLYKCREEKESEYIPPTTRELEERELDQTELEQSIQNLRALVSNYHKIYRDSGGRDKEALNRWTVYEAELIDTMNKLDQLPPYPKGQTILHEIFRCSGYVRISDPIGTRVCEMEASYYGKSSKSFFEASGCAWR